jgi:hypothetical protein
MHFLTAGRFHDEIPLADLDDILREFGYLLIDEDGTPWAGFLLGADAHATFDIGVLETETDGLYAKIINTNLWMSWYRFHTGRYEIVAYLG